MNALMQSESSELDAYETQLFALRESVEVIWLEIGKILADINDRKLYRYRQDENGNYFRNAKAYFDWLDVRFRERGWNLSQRTLYKYMADHRLYREQLQLAEEDLLLLGKSALEEMAPAVRKLVKEGDIETAASLVNDVLDAARANDGIPLAEVRVAVDEYTGRQSKGLSCEFKNGVFGRRLSKLTLFWGERVIDVLTTEVTPEQENWFRRRLGLPSLNTDA